MVDFLSIWSQKIVVSLVICTLIEMLLPEGKNKKYVRTIIGIYIVFTIINPIVSKINTKQDLNLEKYLNFYDNNTIKTSTIIDNNKYVEELYKEKLATDIKTKINVLGYTVESIDIEIETKNNENYGNVLGINLSIINMQEEKVENKIYIEQIVIGNKKNIDKTKISSEEIEKIKEYLQEIYYIDKDRIKVD